MLYLAFFDGNDFVVDTDDLVCEPFSYDIKRCLDENNIRVVGSLDAYLVVEGYFITVLSYCMVYCTRRKCEILLGVCIIQLILKVVRRNGEF